MSDLGTACLQCYHCCEKPSNVAAVLPKFEMSRYRENGLLVCESDRVNSHEPSNGCLTGNRQIKLADTVYQRV